MKEKQDHHVSYDPEIIKEVDRSWHVNHHGHGTGPPKGYKPRRISRPRDRVSGLAKFTATMLGVLLAWSLLYLWEKGVFI